jgi:glycosyltransferase involved in cell wall biosynthesis
VPKIRALAARLDEVVVLALSAVPGVLPDNCRVKTFDARTRLARGARFEAALVPELARRPAALLAHMSPIYALLAAPLARPLGVRVLLWYVQWRTNPKLERAVRASNLVLTADVRSFPATTSKVRPIGHGIDIERFACTGPRARPRLRLLALGRYSPVKDYDVMVRALADVDAELTIHGSCETELDRRTRTEVEQLVAELGLGDKVTLGDPVEPSSVPGLLADADALLNATRGGADKAVYEACASCRPAFASAPSFADLLPNELRFAGADELASRLEAFASTQADARAALGRQLRERVQRDHSVDTWADRVLEAAGL